MNPEAPVAPVLLVASQSQLPPHLRVWGTGGWVDPEQREALDWLTLARMLGWDVDIATPDAGAMAAHGMRDRIWVVLGCAPEELSAEAASLLRSWLEAEAIVVVGRAAAAGLPWSDLAGVALSGGQANGHGLRWQGEVDETWRCRKPFATYGVRLEDGVVAMADVDGVPAVVGKRVGRGTVVTLAFHPSAARDDNGAATALLRQMMVCTSARPVAWIDFSGAVALRMDDPGSAQSVYLESWRYRQLGGAEWARVGGILDARRARLSVGYVGGWVDDGDATRGNLAVGGNAVSSRRAGSVHPSPEVVYRSAGSSVPEVVHDYAGQYRALRTLLAQGVIDIELHGYTHMHPDSERWARAPDRYHAVDWYREFAAGAQPHLAGLPTEAHPLALGIRTIERYFGVTPSTLICPGDEWTNEALEVALALGVRAVSSYYLALRHDNRFCWAQHVCAPYLNEPDEHWFDSGLPVVGYFHDEDVARHGREWVPEWLDRWSASGAKRFVTLRELTAVASVTLAAPGSADSWVLEVRGEGVCAGGSTLPVRIRVPGCPLPRRIAARMGEGSTTQSFDVDAEGRMHVGLSPPPAPTRNRIATSC